VDERARLISCRPCKDYELALSARTCRPYVAPIMASAMMGIGAWPMAEGERSKVSGHRTSAEPRLVARRTDGDDQVEKLEESRTAGVVIRRDASETQEAAGDSHRRRWRAGSDDAEAQRVSFCSKAK
jgi:hypothetical protein